MLPVRAPPLCPHFLLFIRSSLQESCVYSDRPPTRRSDTQVSILSPDARHAQYLTKGSFLPNPIGTVPYCHPALQPGADWLSSRVASLNTDEILTQQIHIVFASIEHELENICSGFLATINIWVPVVIESQLIEQIADIGSTKRSDVCALILSIYLVTRTPGSHNEDTPDPLYRILKSFHSKLQSSDKTTIQVIQTSILISIYEHGQALDEECYLTLGSCSRMGHVMGIHKTLTQDPPNDTAERVNFETNKHVWWCIVMMER
jgi:hypothetical protein